MSDFRARMFYFIIISLPKTKKGVFKKNLYYRRFYGFMSLTFAF